ncbi:uncharacterized protein [Typha angustifolia]|uniref:uncharacterized protein n=1 Tax=Typha angustifolia TaxID=59011 RepID=UPI003C2D5B53
MSMRLAILLAEAISLLSPLSSDLNLHYPFQLHPPKSHHGSDWQLIHGPLHGLGPFPDAILYIYLQLALVHLRLNLSPPDNTFSLQTSSLCSWSFSIRGGEQVRVVSYAMPRHYCDFYDTYLAHDSENLGQAAAFQQVGASFNQHLSLPGNMWRPRFPVLPPPILPLGASSAPLIPVVSPLFCQTQTRRLCLDGFRDDQSILRVTEIRNLLQKQRIAESSEKNISNRVVDIKGYLSNRASLAEQ